MMLKRGPASSQHWVSVVLNCSGYRHQLEIVMNIYQKPNYGTNIFRKKFFFIITTTPESQSFLCDIKWVAGNNDMVRGFIQRPTKPKNTYSIIV